MNAHDKAAAKAGSPNEVAEPLTTIFVCTTCRDAAHDPALPSAGARLYAALLAEGEMAGIAIVPVECLSVCKRTCAISFAAPGKWTYVYGDLPADSAAATICAGAALYGATADGIIPWRQRPDALKKGVIARIPPIAQGCGP